MPTTATSPPPLWRRALPLLAVLALTACAATGPAEQPWTALLPTPLLLVGEVHDAPEHQRLQQDLVRHLAERGQLAALVIEMAEQGRGTEQLARDADEAAVRGALAWDESGGTGGWSWAVYGPVVMAAVRAGVPVFGGNLPRQRLRMAMVDERLDQMLDEPALLRLRHLVREGHCQLLPESQIAPMTRVQIGRDRSLALTAQLALSPGRTVVLIAGNEHVRKDLGIPRHLPSGLPLKVLQAQPGAEVPPDTGLADRVWQSPARAPRDHCAELRQHWRGG